jgi:hypothetical protein
MRPAMHDLAPPLVEEPPVFQLGVDGANRRSDPTDRIRVAVRQGIISRHQHPVIELGIELVKQLWVSAPAES